MILRDRATSDGGALSERLYAIYNPQGTITAVVDTDGNVVERYIYNITGQMQALDASGAVFFQNTNFGNTTEEKLGAYYDAPASANGFLGKSIFDPGIAGTQVAWKYYWHGMRFMNTSGLYAGDGGQAYNPRLGRWMSPSLPVKQSGGNGYRYSDEQLADPGGVFWSTFSDQALTRTSGFLQMSFGAVETAIGVATLKAGVGVIPLVHGMDMAAAGLQTWITGKTHQTWTHRGRGTVYGRQPGCGSMDRCRWRRGNQFRRNVGSGADEVVGVCSLIRPVGRRCAFRVRSANCTALSGRCLWWSSAGVSIPSGHGCATRTPCADSASIRGGNNQCPSSRVVGVRIAALQ